MMILFLAFISLILSHSVTATEISIPDNIFLIRTMDINTGKPVPLVELEAFNSLIYQSDNLGCIALMEPDLESREVRFIVRGHGWQIPEVDFFGERSVTLKVTHGKQALINLERTAPAERLYRITGSGRYRDSLLAGVVSQTDASNLTGGILGLDSAVPVFFKDNLYIFYGDTLGPHHLNLRGSGAIVNLNNEVPDHLLPLDFFTDNDGFASKMIPLEGQGFVWIEAVIPVKFKDETVLAARYVMHETLENAVETGYALFNEDKHHFEVIRRIPSDRHHKSSRPTAVKWSIANNKSITISNSENSTLSEIKSNDASRTQNGYALYPWERTTDNLSTFIDDSSHEYYSCLQNNISVERSKSGRLVFQWKKGGIPYSPAVQARLLAEGRISENERWLTLYDLETGRSITNFTGSISYNDYLKRWIMIAQGNTGEIWYSEADTYTGPWLYARKIAFHDGYNFYNPVHHSWFDVDGGRIIYFEGTYTAFFTSKEHKKPRTDYNQIMYKLNLETDRPVIPIPLYRLIRDQDNVNREGESLLSGSEIQAHNLWDDVLDVSCYIYPDGSMNPSENHISLIRDRSSMQIDTSAIDTSEYSFINNEAFVLRADQAVMTWDPDIHPE